MVLGKRLKHLLSSANRLQKLKSLIQLKMFMKNSLSMPISTQKSPNTKMRQFLPRVEQQSLTLSSGLNSEILILFTSEPLVKNSTQQTKKKLQSQLFTLVWLRWTKCTEEMISKGVLKSQAIVRVINSSTNLTSFVTVNRCSVPINKHLESSLGVQCNLVSRWSLNQLKIRQLVA